MSKNSFFYSHAFTMFSSEPGTSHDKDQDLADDYAGSREVALAEKTSGEMGFTAFSLHGDDLFVM